MLNMIYYLRIQSRGPDQHLSGNGNGNSDTSSSFERHEQARVAQALRRRIHKTGVGVPRIEASGPKRQGLLRRFPVCDIQCSKRPSELVEADRQREGRT
jgi:hypothetical protein